MPCFSTYGSDIRRLARKLARLDGADLERALITGAHFVRSWCASMDRGGGREHIDDTLEFELDELDRDMAELPESEGRRRLIENTGRLRKTAVPAPAPDRGST